MPFVSAQGDRFPQPNDIYMFMQMYIKYATFYACVLDVIPTKRPLISTLSVN